MLNSDPAEPVGDDGDPVLIVVEVAPWPIIVRLTLSGITSGLVWEVSVGLTPESMTIK